MAFRALGASVAGGTCGGAIAGLGARLDMRIIAVMSRSHYGETNHSSVPIGITTFDGTMSLVVEGAIYGVLGGLLYGVIRRWLPSSRWARGGTFSAILLLVTWSILLNGSYEYVRYVSVAVSVPLFASLFVVYGVTTSVIAELIAGDRERVVDGRRVWAYRALLVAGSVLGAVQVLKSLHLVYHLI